MGRAARDELTDTAADAAIEQACRILRLPTIRERHGEIAAAACAVPAGGICGRRVLMARHFRYRWGWYFQIT
jgi:hypothetical protein